ncbi:MAG: hypothetical protein O2780_18995 [Proteobacteria bacterium]|jgi:CubicO group peptidase (beta-lactamase class C family)|nr:hypothetical protein [Pseudomonadota bacterium]MDA1300332.1 hypothetical protein [Pseudomonadota bacterium]
MWGDTRVIPENWINASLTAHVDAGNGIGYGYMWWIMPDGVVMATGTGGQKIWLDRKNQLMIVNRVDTGDGLSRGLWWDLGVRVNNNHMRELHQQVLAALEQP